MTTAHWQRPLKGDVRPSTHLLLWQDEDMRPSRRRGQTARVMAGRRRAWLIQAARDRLHVASRPAWTADSDLDALILSSHPGKGTLTVWVTRGWTDLVSTGLAELIDTGA